MNGRRFLITGRVQGVGFRQHVYRSATTLGLVGEVWNRRDGAVECLAYGEDSALAILESEISRGPGRVDSVQGIPAPVAEPTEFTIGPTR